MDNEEIIIYNDEDSNSNKELAPENIYLPIGSINIRKKKKTKIPSRIRKNIELLGECVGEALKRQQNFSQEVVKKNFRQFMQLQDLKIPKRWFHLSRYEYKLVLANEEEAKQIIRQSKIDLQEILTFCIKKLENQEEKMNFLTIEERVKIITTFEKVPNSTKLSHLFGVPYNIIGHIMNNRDKIMKYYNKISKSVEIKSNDIILPKLTLKMREDRRLIPDVTLKNIELLGDCVCEALKRQQRFSQAWINITTREFLEIMQRKHFKIPDCWFKYASFDFGLTFATEEEAQKETLPVEIDLHEILTFCVKKLVNKNKEDTTIGGSNNSRCQLKSLEHSSSLDPKHLKITTYSDVLKILNPIKDFAEFCANNEGLEYISKLEDHIKNKVNIHSATKVYVQN